MLPVFKRITDSTFLPKVLVLLQYLLARVHLFILPWLILAYFEYLARDNVKAMLTWSWQQPLQLWLNYIIIAAFLLLFSGIFGRTWAAFLAFSTLMTVVGFVSGVKLKMLGIPLMPWDVLLSKETAAISTYVRGIWSWVLLGWTLLFITISYVLIKFVPRFNLKFSWLERAAFVVIAGFVLSTVFWEKPFDLKSNFSIQNVTFDQSANYKLNGFLVATALNIKLSFVPQPLDYSEDNMNALIQSIPRRTNIDPNMKPNIIVVLSESLWDPTLLPKVTYDRDPIPYFRELMKNYSSGMMLSPQFGGGTANVEFEVLTGNSMRFMPPGSTPYIQYVNHGIDSLASILSRQGYATTAMNPFFNWFYNNKTVFKDFGFSQFISLEFFDQNFKGTQIADSEVTKTIIAQTEKSPGPDFIFASTMENHQPYDAGKFDVDPIKVSGNISAKSLGMLESYTTGVADADLMLKSLVEYYTKSKEPTIIVFFGDHKPILGSNYGVFAETGYIRPLEISSLHKIYDVPLVVWDNYLPKHKDKLDISPAFLGPYLLNLAQKEGTAYTDYLYNLSHKNAIIPPTAYYKAYHIQADDLKPYKLFQYDMMFGQQYLLHDIEQPIVSPQFKLGYGTMVIDSVTPSEVTTGVAFQPEGDYSTFLLTGQNFVETSDVYMNGKALKTWLQGDGKLKAELPNDMIPKAKDLVLEVKVIDSHGVIVSSSNRVTIPMKKQVR